MKLMHWAVLAFLGWAGMAAAQAVEDGVTVTGVGEVALAPDMATITLGVTEVGGTARDAMAEVSVAVAAIIGKLDALGVAPRDRQTSRFYLRPVYEPHEDRGPDRATPPQIIGYEAGNSVTIRVQDLEKIGVLLDTVIEEGANDFNGINFGLKDDSVALAEARKLAVADALARADLLAEAAGIELGVVTRMTENSGSDHPVMMEMSQARGAFKAPVEAGELSVRAQVTMTFAIKPGI
jgi:uncharacterized protein